jgi:outer membrane protein
VANRRAKTIDGRRTKHNCWLVSVSVAVFLLAGYGSQAHAETLRGALAAAYKYNPDIEAERANLRATDEEVPRAKSGYRPRLNANADIGAVNRRRKFSGGASRSVTTEPRGYDIGIDQNVFDGFQTTNSVNAAEALVRSGRANLHTTEQTVLLDTVRAYMNVVRDQAIVRLRENNVRVLTSDLKATQDRFNAGEVTRTDVAQSRARRAESISDLDEARANLKASRANYERLVGRPPSRLQTASVPERLLPKTLEEARRRAVNEAPAVVAALYLEQAERYNVERIWGELLPSVTVRGEYAKRFGEEGGIDSVEATSVLGNLRIPLYQGGEVRARLRQAKHLHVRQIQLVAQARTIAREEVETAWAALNASRATLRSDKASVEANQIALAGVREEEKVGQRTLLDVLNAEQELLDSQVSLVTSERNLVVSAYALIAFTGRLTAKELGLSDRIYDAEEHYFDVRRKWFGISITHQDGRREHVNVWNSHGKDRSYK